MTKSGLVKQFSESEDECGPSNALLISRGRRRSPARHSSDVGNWSLTTSYPWAKNRRGWGYRIPICHYHFRRDNDEKVFSQLRW